MYIYRRTAISFYVVVDTFVIHCQQSETWMASVSSVMLLANVCELEIYIRDAYRCFKYLFKNKGSDYEHGLGRLYTDTDFDRTFFLSEWYGVHDRLGDGM